VQSDGSNKLTQTGCQNNSMHTGMDSLLNNASSIALRPSSSNRKDSGKRHVMLQSVMGLSFKEVPYLLSSLVLHSMFSQLWRFTHLTMILVLKALRSCFPPLSLAFKIVVWSAAVDTSDLHWHLLKPKLAGSAQSAAELLK